VTCRHDAGEGAVGACRGEGNGVEGEGVEVVLLSSGAEVVLCQEASEKLREKGIRYELSKHCTVLHCTNCRLLQYWTVLYCCHSTVL